MVRLSWEPVDQHTALTVVAVIGLGIGAALAVFGLPPLDVHLPLHRLGVMMPGCGGTRALRLTMLSQWGRAWEYNPASVVLAAGAALTLVRAVVGMVSGKWLTMRICWGPMTWTLLVVLFVALSVRQQLHAELLVGP